MIESACPIVVQVCDQPLSDDVLGLIQSEIQPIFIVTPALDFVMTPEIVVSIHIQ